jgi:hypothetical protein
MQELAKRIALLRLLLADIEGKQAQLSEMEHQYRGQLNRIVEFVVYREGDVGNALSLMSEVQDKLNEVIQTEAHLQTIRARANTELEVLVLTKRVSEARSQLAQLEEQQHELAERLESMTGSRTEQSSASAGDTASDVEEIRGIYLQVESEIARLHTLITDASDRAARTVQERDKAKG